MDLTCKVIRVEGRNLMFHGTVHKGIMDVTHVVDVSRAKMYSFFHRHYMGKNAAAPFDCSDRRKINSAVKRKHGIAEALCFEHYICKLTMTADEHGDNQIDMYDRRDDSDVLGGFAEKHWELSV